MRPPPAEKQDPTAWPSIAGFEIRSVLGRGGIGVVYEVLELSTGRELALKMLRRPDVAGVHDLKREFRILADITHPNLVVLHELAFAGGHWFFTMELVRGPSFFAHLGLDQESPSSCPTVDTTASMEPSTPVAFRNRAVDEPRLRDAFVQLSRGVAAVHAAGRLHCDIKPSNVLVDENARIVLADFGLTSAYGAVVRPGSGQRLMGTPVYMSPEHVAGASSLGPASDWYAVGVMLYEALSGIVPFGGADSSVLSMKGSAVPALPSTFNPSVPADLEALAMDLLAIDPADRPGAEEVLERLGGSGRSRSRSRLTAGESPPQVPFVGRTFELAQLRKASRELDAPTLVLVTGRSGMGKTRLLDEFLREEAARGSLVLRGRCYQRESVPYKGVDAVVDELAAFLMTRPEREVAAWDLPDLPALTQAFPALVRVPGLAAPGRRPALEGDPQELRRRSLNALRQLFARVAEAHHLIASVDDAQWSDLESIHLLHALLSGSDAPRMLVVATARDEGNVAVSALRELGQRVGALELPLSELEQGDVEKLAGALLPKHSDVAAVARECGGNPYFVVELSLHLRDGLLVADADPGPRRTRLDALLLHRIDLLPENARTLLELIAVAGRSTPRTVLFRALGGDAAELSAWARLVAERLARVTGDADSSSQGLECHHDRVRELVMESLAPERLSACHAALAAAMEQVGVGDAEQLLEHYVGSAQFERALVHAKRAADAAAFAFAFGRAARLYEAALRLGAPPAAEQLELRVRRAEALVYAGRIAEAALAYEEAAPLATGLRVAELKRLAAQHFLTSGDSEKGTALLREALNALGLPYPATTTGALMRLAWERARIRAGRLRFQERVYEDEACVELRRVDACFSAAAGLAMSDMLRGAVFSALHLRLALKSGELGRIARGIAFELGVAPAVGREGMRWAEHALPVARMLTQRYATPYQSALLRVAEGHVAYLGGAWTRAVALLEEAVQRLHGASGHDVQWAILSTNVLLLGAAAAVGDFDVLSRRLPACIEGARERSDAHTAALLRFPRVVCALATDALESARDVVAEVETPEGGFHLRHFAGLHAQLFVDRFTGDWRQARERLDAAWPVIVRSNLLQVNVVRVTALAERGSAALGGPASAVDETHRKVGLTCARKLEREDLPFAKALADLLYARVAVLEGDRGRARQLLERASDRFAACDMRLHAHSATRAAGVLAGAGGEEQIAQADAALRRAGVKNPARFAATWVPGVADA